MTESAREWLKEIIRSKLIPAFEQHGFRRIPLAGDDARSPEIRSAFPFGRLRRESAQGYETVEIQLDKRGRPAFRLNIGIAPPGGIVHASSVIEQDEVWVHYLNHYFEMYRHPMFRRWFVARGRLGSAPARSDVEALVEKVVTLVPEIEDVFARGKSGPHMRRVES